MFARISIATAAAIALAIAHAPNSKAEETKTPDVFLDEGTGDDFAEPAPMADPSVTAAQDGGAATEPVKPKTSKKNAKAATKSAAKSAKATVKDAEDAAERAEAQAEELAGAAEAPARKTKTKPVTAGFFKTTKGACSMHASPSDDSAKLIEVAAGRKLWLEPAGEGWFKAFRKTGEGYLSSGCF